MGPWRRVSSTAIEAGGVRGSWNRFWFAEASPRSYALFRIALGVFLLAYFLPLLPRVPLLFSSEGVYLPVLIPDFAPPPAVAWAVYGAFLLLLALFTVGVRTAVVAPLVLGGFLYHYLLNLAASDTAYDRLTGIFLAVACLAPLDGAWAAAGGRRRPVTVFAARLLTLQLAFLYTGSGLWKLWNPQWHSGGILELTLLGPWGSDWGRAVATAGLPAPAWDFMAWGVIGFEILAGPLLFVPRARVVVLVLALGFHLAVWVFLQIPEFLVCATAFPLVFARRIGARPRE